MAELVEQPSLDSIEDEGQLIDAMKAQVEAMNASNEPTEQPDVIEGEVVAVDEPTDKPETIEDSEEVVEEGDEIVDDSFDFDFEDEAVLNKPFKKPIMVKRKGVEIPVNNFKEALELLPKSIDYTVKMQQIAPHRKTIDYMTQHGLSMDDLQRLADAKRGNKDALASIAKEAKIDVWEVDADADYKPSANVQFTETSEVESIAMEILADDAWATSVKTTTELVPESFKARLTQDPVLLRAFADDAKTGTAQKLIPEALKINAMNPSMDFIHAYLAAGDKIFGQEVAQQQAQAPVAPTLPPKQTNKVDTAARTKAGSPKASQSSGKATLDLWEDGLSESDLAARIQEVANQHRI